VAKSISDVERNSGGSDAVPERSRGAPSGIGHSDTIYLCVVAYDGVVKVERGVPADATAALARLGHQIVAAPGPIGGGQAIWIDSARGVLIGGSDPRKDGMALGY
jgi:hypothetical protein